MQPSATYRRHSLLRRNPALDRAAFSHHYETVHGPLAAGLAGFRRFASRYLQNHMELAPEAPDPLFDGITMTTQVPREDYTRGFFNDPDYQKVTADERYLFDIGRTVSVLGREEIANDGPRSRWKTIVLAPGAEAVPQGGCRVELNHLEVATASALGFGAGVFEYGLLAEVWFETSDDRARAVQAALPGTVVLPVREILVFGPSRPWVAAGPA